MSAETIPAAALAGPIAGARLVPLVGGDTRAAELALVTARAHQLGLAAGAQLAGDTCAELLNQVAQQCAAAEEALASTLAHTAAEIAMEIARVLLRHEIANDRFDLEAIVRETLAAGTTERGRCVVHLHPEDAARLADVPFRAGTTLALAFDDGVESRFFGKSPIAWPH